jgi:folylpolyglutamate synthase/dihydropteroate synthase
MGKTYQSSLGNDLRSIAWHKAGVFKPGSSVFTAVQEDAAVDVLRQRPSDFHQVPRFTHNANTNLEVMAERARCAKAAGGASSALRATASKYSTGERRCPAAATATITA